MADTQDVPPWVKLKTLTPKEAYDFFKAKKLVPSFRWTDVWAAEHAAAGTIAGQMSEDVLALIYDHLGEAIKDGRDLAWFQAEMIPRLIDAGWWGNVEVVDPATGEVRETKVNPSRLELIYEVNVRSAYAAGAWERAQRTKRTAPFLMYRTMRDERVRHSHAEWDGVTLPIDHPFWDQHYPPNGYRCRCIARSISEAGIQDLIDAGQTVKRDAPAESWTEYERNGERVKVPTGVDPGFDYNVGKARAAAVDAAAARSRAKLPEPIRAAADKLGKPGSRKKPT